jgi:hypothetical protein
MRGKRVINLLCDTILRYIQYIMRCDVHVSADVLFSNNVCIVGFYIYKYRYQIQYARRFSGITKIERLESQISFRSNDTKGPKQDSHSRLAKYTYTCGRRTMVLLITILFRSSKFQ